MLLIAANLLRKKAVEMMIHIWYSALIDKEAIHSLPSEILPLIQDVCAKIGGRSEEIPQSKRWVAELSPLESE